MSVRKLSDYPAIETLLSSYDLPGHASMAQKKDPYEFYFGDESPVQFESEPGPSLKYNIIYVWAVRLAPVIRDRSQKKKFLDAFEDVADARSNYHRCSLEYRKAYNELQDTSLFHEIMTERKEEVEKQIAQWQEKGDMESVLKQKQKELETFKWQIQKNDKSGQPLLEKAQTLARIKAQVSMHFVDMKISLIKDYLPYMAILEMQCLVAMQQRAAMQHRVAMIRMAKGRYYSTFSVASMLTIHKPPAPQCNRLSKKRP